MNRYARLTDLLRRTIDNGPAGCALSVVRHGEIEFQEYQGFADLETRTKIGADTIYRIYSMTKVVTCVAALQLFEQGRYLLNDPLYEYLPEFKDLGVYRYDALGAQSVSAAAGPIRVKDLFTMTSGLTYGGDGSQTERDTAKVWQNGLGTMDTRASTRALAAVPLAFDPGTHWKYGSSHDVLAALIEVVSGQSFGQYLESNIFGPLGMTATSFRIAQDKRARLCTMYTRADGGKLAPTTKMDAPYESGHRHESGGAGLLSTLGDYSRFAQALTRGGEFDGIRLLSRKTVQLMATNHLRQPQLADFDWQQVSGYGYGLGVRVLIDPPAGGVNGSIGEFGWAGLAGSWLLVDPIEQMSVVYMQQMLPSLESYIHPRLRASIYGAFDQ